MTRWLPAAYFDRRLASIEGRPANSSGPFGERQTQRAACFRRSDSRFGGSPLLAPTAFWKSDERTRLRQQSSEEGQLQLRWRPTASGALPPNRVNLRRFDSVVPKFRELLRTPTDSGSQDFFQETCK